MGGQFIQSVHWSGWWKYDQIFLSWGLFEVICSCFPLAPALGTPLTTEWRCMRELSPLRSDYMASAGVPWAYCMKDKAFSLTCKPCCELVPAVSSGCISYRAYHSSTVFDLHTFQFILFFIEVLITNVQPYGFNTFLYLCVTTLRSIHKAFFSLPKFPLCPFKVYTHPTHHPRFYLFLNFTWLQLCNMYYFVCVLST